MSRNYRHALLLPICEKIFNVWRLLFYFLVYGSADVFFLLQNRKKKIYFTDFLFSFCPLTLRYFTSPRTTSVCFLYINRKWWPYEINLGSKQSIGVKYKDDICRIVFKALVWKRRVFLYFYWVRMVLKATTQQLRSKQSLCKVSSESFFRLNFLKNFETGKQLCWSLFLITLQA